ncbi:hypothetical protein BXZ70DRAFT_1079150 [Cristinia sonorae]|uniref:Letm1 RBD domain-containing protein n=1 Tax=Cristinia sonorae TaxID=1940300 RepID=A0A8K0UKB8_9AGAR|nr:hypothetical protein BXZ70DRAFT_1079150 [Cristinia sonorae]
MISALRRDGVALGNSAIRRHSSTIKASHHRHILRQHVLLPNGQRVQLVASARHFSCTTRRLASVPQDPEKLPLSDGAPPHIPPPKKHKVDLKPGPLKPRTPEAASTLPSSPLPEHNASLTKPSDTTSPASSTEPSGSVIETAKQDFADASQHGILAPPPEGASRIRTLFHQAKELFKFYVRGLKLIFTNSKRAKEMQERVKAGGPPLSRWETRFIRTCKEDMLKLIPFAMIIIILEEIIPLVVLYAPFILPSTCILPSQKERIDAKKREKQRVFLASYQEIFAQLAENAAADASVDSSLSGVLVKPIAGLVGLSTYTPRFLQVSALKRHLKMLSDDDALLLHEHKGAHLTQAELRQALFDRGIITDEVPQDLWRSRLNWWLDSAEKLSSSSSAADPASVRLRLIAQGVLGRF